MTPRAHTIITHLALGAAGAALGFTLARLAGMVAGLIAGDAW